MVPMVLEAQGFSMVFLWLVSCGTGLAATFDHELLLTTGKLMNIEAKFKMRT